MPDSELRILIVEDEPLVGQLFASVLSEDGYIVTLAVTGRAALRHVSDYDYSVGIVDMSLPDLDGAYLIPMILSERPHMRILAVTGMMVAAMQAVALQAGATVVLGKPVSPNELRAAVFHLIDPADHWLATTHRATESSPLSEAARSTPSFKSTQRAFAASWQGLANYRSACFHPDCRSLDLGHTRALPFTSNTKLPKVMIQVLVGQDCPFRRSHRPEKAMRMLRALLGAASRKTIHVSSKTLPLRGEVSFVAYHQASVRWHVATNWRIAQNASFCHAAEDVSDPASRWRRLSGSDLHPFGAMRQHLRCVHFAPLALALRT